MQGGRPPETVDKTLSMVFRCKADGAALQRRRHHVPVREAHGRNMIAEASCRLAFRPSKDPLGEVWRAEALQMESKPGDMRGGFGSLAQQGFPARFPGRAPGAGETCPVGKGRQRRPFPTSWSGCKPLPLSCSGRALRAQEHDVPFAARLPVSLAAKGRRLVDGQKPCAARFSISHFCGDAGRGGKPLPVPSAATNPFGEAWRAEALQMQSEPGDMRGGFGSLAQQGFPARFPGRSAY